MLTSMLWVPSTGLLVGNGPVTVQRSTPVTMLLHRQQKLNLVNDLEALITEKECGPILIRLNWHGKCRRGSRPPPLPPALTTAHTGGLTAPAPRAADAGVFSTGELSGGCPNAVMRFTDGGEGTFGANAGLPDVALGLLKPITEKYADTGLISNADLWTLAANTAIKVMGGPDVPTRFGRSDAKTSAESVESQVGRLPDGDKGIDHLRDIFHPKGFSDKDIVALSGAHTVGKCNLDRSGFDGPWTEGFLKFDNTYFKEMLEKTYTMGESAKGCPQNMHESGTIM